MKRLIIAASMVVATCGSGKAQGTFLWTWHGDSNYFHASFLVTGPEMLPNSTFNSSVFSNTFSIISPDGLSYAATNNQYSRLDLGFPPPLHGSAVLYDPATLSRISIAVVPGQGASIHEDSPLPFGQFGENGFWNYATVPEPSVTALAGLGVLFAAKRGGVI